MMINPSETAQVCVKQEFEFTCNVTGTFLEWSFPAINAMALRQFTRGITAEGPAEMHMFQLIENSTTYSITRTSAGGSPVSSRLLISGISYSHNGTEITCSDVGTTESASTIINVIDWQIQGIIVFAYIHRPFILF